MNVLKKLKVQLRKIATNKKIMMPIIILLLVVGGYFVYQWIVGPTPLGVDDDITLSDPIVLNRHHTQDVLLADGSVKNTNDQVYLREVFVQPPIKDGSQEFNQGNSLFNNLIRSLESGSIEDINQGAALYQKNTENFSFSTPENLITAAIGNDLILLDEYNYQVDGVKKASRGKFDTDLGTKLLKSFNSPITIAIVGSRLLPIAHSQFVIDGESHVLDRFLYEPSWYDSMIQFYPGDDLSKSSQPHKIQEAMDKYKGKIVSVYQVKLTGKFAPDVDTIIFEDGEGRLFVYGFYYTDSFSKKQTIEEYMNSEYSTFDNFTIDDLNWNNFRDGFNEIFNQTRD